jgi:DNA-directed RNA polymerase sigma subunit (sigma70/sigma32)
MDTGEKMLKNFIKKYGRQELKKLASYFLMRSSNEEIGEYFGVTRQRVHQWQKAFTSTTTDLQPFVSKVLKAKK